LSDLENFKKAIKALTITEETILFMDIDQFSVEQIKNLECLPKGLLIVGVVGEPNVEAMTRAELQGILDEKKRTARENQGGVDEDRNPDNRCGAGIQAETEVESGKETGS